MKSSWQDLRFAVRMLARSPGFTAVAVLTLALGIGANTAIFSVVHSALLRPLPYHEPERLVWIWGQDTVRGIPHHNFFYADYVDWSKEQQTFESTSAYSLASVNLAGNGGSATPAERILAWRVNASFLSTLGVQPVLGRDFAMADDQPGAGRVVILNEGLWRRRFGGQPEIIGTPIILDGLDYTVIGILPAGFGVAGRNLEALLPIARSGPEVSFTIAAIGRLRPGTDRKQAEAEANHIAARLNERFFSAGRSLRVWGLREFVVRDVQLSLWVLLGAVALVLLIACANVANLLLARAGAREREIAIRTALGAGRIRLVWQLLVESLLLAAAGGIAGVILAEWTVSLLVSLAAESYPLLQQTRLDSTALLYAIGLSAATSLLFGLVPAVSIARSGVHGALKEGGRGATESRNRRRFQNLLVVTEVALALVLSIGASLLTKGLLNLQKLNPGFDSTNVLTAGMSLPAQKYADDQQRTAFYQRMLQELARLPEVESVGAVNYLPLGGTYSGANIHVEGKPEPLPEEAPIVWTRIATADYFKAMRIPLLQGRTFTDHDDASAPPVVIINQALARRYWPDEDPVGRKLALGVSHRPSRPGLPAPTWLTVVGVVGDVRPVSLAEEAGPELFFSAWQQTPAGMTVVIRTASDPHHLAPLLRQAVQAIDSEQALSEVATMEEVVSRSVASRRLSTLLLGIFAGLAILLAAIGTYGVVAFSMNRRTHEMGIRMVLGASNGKVLELALLNVARTVVPALALGVVGSLAVTRVMRGMLYGVTTTDPFIFAGATAVLAAVAMLAGYIPARRAAKVDPVVALRYE